MKKLFIAFVSVGATIHAMQLPLEKQSFMQRMKSALSRQPRQEQGQVRAQLIYPTSAEAEERWCVQLKTDFGISECRRAKRYMALRSNRMRGRATTVTLQDYLAAKKQSKSVHRQQKLQALARSLVKKYKIHLMPRSASELQYVLEQLLAAIRDDDELATHIVDLKILMDIDFSVHNLRTALRVGRKSRILPMIVVYPGAGKAAAQFVLNYLWQLFKNFPGSGITPTYNMKITDLLYYAQGDADFKSDIYAGSYEGAERIFYRADFTGKQQDYALSNPST